VGSKLVDAKGVSRLYRSRISSWQLLLLIFAGLAAATAALFASPAGQVLIVFLQTRWDAFVFWLNGIF
jgi:uncharacterized membrane-anchored protein